MTTTTTARAGAGARFRLGGRARKLVLLTHIAAAGAWLGMDLVLGLLALAAFGAGDVVPAAALVGIATFAGLPLTVLGLLTLASGVVLGLGSKYGLVRYWWVAVKLVITLVLVTLVVLVLDPMSDDLGEAGEAVLTGTGSMPDLGDLAFPPIVSTAAVLFAMTLSVLKPWNRIRR